MAEQEVLSGPQERALLAVMQGDDYTGAALAAGVSRETVSRWANGDTLWARERRRRTEALWREHQNQVVNLLPLALAAVEWLLRNGDYLGEHYNPRAQLDAAMVALRLNGIDVGRGVGLAVQINNTVASAAEFNKEQSQ